MSVSIVPHAPAFLSSANIPGMVHCSKNITFGISDVLELVTLLDSGAAAPYTVGSAGAGASSQLAAVVRPSRCAQAGGCRWLPWPSMPLLQVLTAS